jgi:hypothetical protein
LRCILSEKVAPGTPGAHPGQVSARISSREPFTQILRTSAIWNAWVHYAGAGWGWGSRPIHCTAT